MNEKKINLITFCSLALLSLLLIIFTLRLELHLSNEKEKSSVLEASVNELQQEINDINSHMNSLPAAAERTVKYTVRELDGRIGIFDSLGGLIKTLPTLVEFLPEKDREMLRDGIKLYSDGELYSLIEDYSE